MRRLPLPTLLFFATLFGLPLAQAGLELARGERVQVLELFGPLNAPRLRAFEVALHDASLLQERVVPRYQATLLALLRRGNEQVIASASGWLDYTPDIEHVTGPGVLEPGSTGRLAAETLVRFHDELASAGVELLLVPVPVKSTVEPGPLSGNPELATADNPDLAAWIEQLRGAGLDVLDVSALYAATRIEGTPQYLARDTHWTPTTMRAVARAVARAASELCELSTADDGSDPRYTTRELELSGTGDLVGMLNLPTDSTTFEPLSLQLEAVLDSDGQPWTPSSDAEVLLLGDSFTRVFSDPELGLGTSAGLAEHIALALGRPLDVIALPGGGAAGVRNALARRPRGLAGKRLVIWEFTLRELSAAADDWRWIELPATDSEPPPPGAADEPPDGRREVTAELVEISVLDPDFDYAFCLGIFEYRVLEGEHEGPLWVAFPVLVDHRPTAAAEFVPGLRQRLVLEPIEQHHDLESTSWIDDTDAGFDIFTAVEWSTLE